MPPLPPFLSAPAPGRTPDSPTELSVTEPSPAASSALPCGLLVLQPTPFCNLACDYCYLVSKDQRGRLSHERLRRIVEAVIAEVPLAPRLTVAWHAGEPLVVPPDWYPEALAICARLAGDDVILSHAVQTNATLIDDAWCTLFRESGIRVGVSLDGPRDLHDRHRVARTGAGSFERTLRGIECLRAHDIPFHVICVLTLDSLREPDRLFDFFLATGAAEIAFNIEEIEGPHGHSSLRHPDAAALHRFFMARVLERTKQAAGRIRVRELDQAFNAIANHRDGSAPNQQARPFSILSFDWQGRMSTFSPELLGQPSDDYDDFVFADIDSGGVRRMLESPAYRRAQRAIDAGLARCRAECDYFPVCGGGAPANKLYELGRFDATETIFCRFNKQHLIDLVLGDLEQQLRPSSPGLGQGPAAVANAGDEDR